MAYEILVREVGSTDAPTVFNQHGTEDGAFLMVRVYYDDAVANHGETRPFVEGKATLDTDTPTAVLKTEDPAVELEFYVRTWRDPARRFANLLREFPDYDVTSLPEIPEGFVDTSWRNDQCPTFVNKALGLTLAVDYENPEDREFPEASRFGLMADAWIGDEIVSLQADRGDLYEGDDFAEVLAVIKREAEIPPVSAALLAEVTDLASAKRWIDALVAADLSYHLEDGATDCLQGKVRFSTAILFDVFVGRCYRAQWGPTGAEEEGRFYCPIGYMLSVLPFDPDNQAEGCLPGVEEYYRAEFEDRTLVVYDCVHTADYDYGAPGRYTVEVVNASDETANGLLGEFNDPDAALASDPALKAAWDDGLAAIRAYYAPQPEAHA